MTWAEAGAILHVTHDTSPAIFERIRDGMTLQAIDQQPYLQGYLTVVFLYLHRTLGLALAPRSPVPSSSTRPMSTLSPAW